MSTWRVYEKQWLIVFASDPGALQPGDRPQESCEDKWEHDYAGKVELWDMKVEPFSTSEPERWPWYLKLRLWTMTGEFLGKPVMAGLAGFALVQGGSPEERALLDYGRKKLAV
jgi:hypothetical protein